MRIGIDMRMAGSGEGIGRYVEELVKHISLFDHHNDFFLLHTGKFPISNFSPFGRSLRQFPINFQKVQIKSPCYSFAEQTQFIWELRRLKLDLVHFASFNAPIFYPGKFAVTIHDIIHHMYPGRKKARFIHRLAYRAVISTAVRRAAKVVAVSEATKYDIVQTFGIDEKKIAVVYEGVDEKFFEPLMKSRVLQTKERYGISKPYLLFTGVWRQYKNLERLARAFDILIEQYGHVLELVLVGKIDPFYPEIKRAVFSVKNARHVRALGFVPDEDLKNLYQGAAAFVLPSLVEGFGLIGVEAQAAGTPVAASDVAVLREILGEGAVYFDPRDEKQMAQVINVVLRDSHLAAKLIDRGRENARRFNWQDTARKTLEIYEKV